MKRGGSTECLSGFRALVGSHLRFVYEENPGMDVASVDGKSREEKIAALERALVKPYSVDLIGRVGRSKSSSR